MQTLRLFHRLDLRLIGVSGGAIAKWASESKSDLESNFVINVGVSEWVKQHRPLGNNKKTFHYK